LKKKKSAPTPPLHPKEEQLSSGKLWAFRIALLLFPLLAFLLLELFLRAIDYGGNLDLVVKKEIGGKQYYAINRAVGKRYFAGSGFVSPEPASDIFEVNKSDTTIRIFCLGESTMAGFPYSMNATAPSLLRERLRDLFPHSKIEVVNLGLSAITSYIVLDFVRELVSYKPDLFVVYLGHNEFYGVYGAGSSIRIPGGHWLTSLTIRLLKSKTYLLLRSVLASVRRAISDNTGRQGFSLMGVMVQEQYIPYGSDLYRAAIKAYRDNLESIISVAQSHRVPILFSELVSNVKDHPPFHSVFSDGTPPEVRAKWQSLKAIADTLFASQRHSEARDLYQQCTSLDSLNASGFYDLGLAEYALGRFDHARTLLKRAKDLDALRFRASEEFKQVLKEVCAAKGVPLAPVDSAFEANSPHGITGQNLMLEHLHPNLKGYSLMARVFAQTIAGCQLLGTIDSLTPTKIKDDEYYLSSSGVTVFDETAGRITIDLLTHKWPFVVADSGYRFKPRDNVEHIAYRYIEEDLPWSTARYELADYFFQNKQYELARRECYAVAKAYPFLYQPLVKAADYHRLEGNRDSARATYLRSIRTEDNPYARSKLAIMLLEENQPDQAVLQLNAGLKVAARPGMSLGREATAADHYLLGVAYAKLGKLDLAREQLNQSLSINPRFQNARKLLEQIEQRITSQ
jgi:lysophospholipase L1-like esterase/Flp pilus assembly protein TadD